MPKKEFMQEMKCQGNNYAGSGAVYGLGFVGAAIYFFQHATTFWEVVMGLLKAMVWPAFLSFYALKFLNVQ